MAPSLVDLFYSMPEFTNPLLVFVYGIVLNVLDALSTPLMSLIRNWLEGLLDVIA